MSTFIHGIGASEMIDSSGEIVSIQGMDISSLPKDGVFNWEHKKDTPMQTVGKVLKAKKIFSQEDCEDDHELYFWNLVQCPYVYVMGELLDDYTESAKHVAGMFMYDADRKGKQEFPIVSFSIEGATIEKPKGTNVVTRSIARKVTITNLPCNKTAGAEMVQADQNGNVHDLFKTENPGILVLRVEAPKPIAVDLLKHAEALGIPMLKAEPLKPKTTMAGQSIGATSSGKNVMSHGKVHEYHKFSHQDHTDAADLHHAAGAEHQKLGNRPMVDHHIQKKKMHIQAAAGAKRRSERFGRGMERKIAKRNTLLKKTMTAGSGSVAPGQLTGGAALAKEHLNGKLHKEEAPPPPPPPTLGQTATSGGTSTINTAIGSPFGKAEGTPVHGSSNIPDAHPNDLHGKSHSIKGVMMRYARSTAAAHHFYHPSGKGMVQVKRNRVLQKSYWLERAEDEYKNWDKKDIFVKFMSERMPNLTKAEIDCLGQTVALKKSLELEAELAKLKKK